MAMVGDIFEIIMILAFGFSWPFNIIRAYKARTAKGTSLQFIVLIGSGYVAGILSKFFAWGFGAVEGFWVFTKVLATVFYFVNLTLIITALVIYFRNKKLDAKRESLSGDKTLEK